MKDCIFILGNIAFDFPFKTYHLLRRCNGNSNIFRWERFRNQCSSHITYWQVYIILSLLTLAPVLATCIYICQYLQLFMTCKTLFSLSLLCTNIIKLQICMYVCMYFPTSIQLNNN